MVTTDSRDTDADRLSRLLYEFGSKLSLVMNQRDTINSRRNLLLAFDWIFAIAIVLYGIHDDKQLGHNLSSARFMITISLLVMTGLIFFLTIGLSLVRRSRLLSEEIRVSAIKLAALVRVASQFHEHSPRGFIADLELDLRLTEAESVLRRVEKTIGLRLVSSTSEVSQPRQAGARNPGEPQPR